jgi:dihydrofolate reductase
MRDLAILTFITMDGVMQAPSMPDEDRSGGFNGGGWAAPYWSGVMEQVQAEAMAKPYDMLFGRKTYDLFAGHWPDVDGDPVAQMMNAARKYVVTSTPTGLEWNNTEAITGDIAQEIAQLKEQMPDSTMIYVTHDQVEAMTLATRIVVMNGGGVAQVGTPLDLYQRPDNEFVARFIGSPAMNFYPGKICQTGQETRVLLESGRIIDCAIRTTTDKSGLSVNVGLRPEDMVRCEQDAAIISDKVSLTEALGEVTLLYLGSPSEEKVAKLAGVHQDLRDQTVHFNVPADKVHLFSDGLSLRGK